MYFVVGWPQTLTSSENVHSIVPNADQSIFLFLSQDAISLWYCRPVVQIVQYQRTSKSLEQYGTNVAAIWKSDSSQIVVQTSQDFLLFYRVVISEDSDNVLQIVEPNSRRRSLPRDADQEESYKIPALILELQRSFLVSDGITCFMSAEEEIVIATKTGTLCGVEWDGQFDENFRLNVSIPANYHPKKDEPPQSCFILDFKYSTIIGGFALVFSNGLGAFLPWNANTANYTQIQLISHVDSASCTAINHKYALIAFGLNSSNGVLCGFEEIDRRFIISHRLSLPPNVYPDVDKFLGPITALQWTPDSTVLATAWQNGGFALWTVFGSLLTCSLSWNYSLDMDNKMHAGPFRVSSLAFGKEGFHLWMATKSCNLLSSDINEVQSDQEEEPDQFNWVCKLSLAKSVLAANPCSSVSLETVVLASEDRVFVGGTKSSSLYAQLKDEDNENIAQKKMNGNGASDKVDYPVSHSFLCEQESTAVDSFQWLTIPLSQSYLDSNWPIRYFALDTHSSQNLAITGVNGLAMYSLLQRRWKLFGNENHEKDFVVTGGFIWFYDYIIAGCYNLVHDCFEIRAYSHRDKLDNSNAKIIAIDKEVYQLSLHRNRLLVLCSNGSILLFDLHLFKKNVPNGSDYAAELNISSPIRVIVNNLEIFPDCVTVCLLTDLHVDMYHSAFQSESSHRSQLIQTSAVARSHSILLNICGRVLLLEMDIDTTGLPFSSDDDDDDDSDSTKHNNNSAEIIMPKKVNGDFEPTTIKYRKAVKLASNVENLWILPHDEVHLNAFLPSLAYTNRNQQLRPHLVTSLYLSCGAQGMAVWLSLEHSIRPQFSKGAKKDFVSNNENDHAYISKRIMLPINEIASNIYPLAIRFREAIVLGAESDFTHPNSYCFSRTDDSSFIPFCLVKRTSQVYLHYILRELLRRNLGYRAWEIANTCTALPHFVHSLELLLHGVLEEEASSSQPIPDALLPRVVDFIRAFPVFLQTVIHCARKTELALWPHLFSVVGSPKDLFQQCLLEGQLETASSYIIVLQNLEKPEVATKCASRLLQAARIAGSWVTVKELKRFLRATNYAEESEIASNSGQLADSAEVATTPITTTVRDRTKSETQDCQTNIVTSHNNTNGGPTMNGQNGSYPNVLSRSNSVEQSSAKGTPLASHNHINSYSSAMSRTIPGAAIKQNDPSVEVAKSSSPVQEENVVMKEADDSSKDGEGSSLSNSDQDPIEPVEEIQVDTIAYTGHHHNHQRNGRAYPGTILRMSHDNHPKAPFHFLTTSSFATVASSTSSISSFSSASSSTISSASVSPIVHKTRPSAGQVDKSPSSSSASELPKMLKVVPINPDETNQCVIS